MCRAQIQLCRHELQIVMGETLQMQEIFFQGKPSDLIYFSSWIACWPERTTASNFGFEVNSSKGGSQGISELLQS